MRMRNWLGIAALAVAAGVGAVAVWHGHLRTAVRPTPSNVILITIDTQRPDRLSCYGYPKHQTPNFDRLARDGVLFENAFCDVTWTTPSMTSVMTGRYATVHHVRSNFDRLPESATTLAEIAQAHGIHTAAIIASYPLASIYGLNQGFALYDESFSKPLIGEGLGATPEDLPAPVTPGADLFGDSRQPMLWYLLRKSTHDAYRPDDQVSDRAIRWLREERKEPFFLWVHYLGPHNKPPAPGEPPTAMTEQSQRYDRDVVSTDRQLGRFLDAIDELKLTDHTAVILHADHGEDLLEHDFIGHGYDLYDVTQRVPLLMRLPGQLPSGRRVTELVHNLDLFPTILALLGIDANLPTDGASLLPLATGANTERNQETYVETYLSATYMFAKRLESEKHRLGIRRLGIRTPDWKFIINDPYPILDRDNPEPVDETLRKQYYSEELYDERADPAEKSNVIDAHSDLAAKFRARVQHYQEMAAGKSEQVQLDPAARERLRSLGYLEK